MPGSHSKLAPSASERWINCPGSVKLGEKFPDTTSIYAEEGSLAHKLGELKLRSRQSGEPINKYEYQKVKDNDLYSADMEDYTNDYVEYIESVINDCKEQPLVEIETKLDLSFIAPKTFGTADCIVLEGNTLHIIDFKYGKNVEVNPVENSQMMIYALGALKLFDGLIFDIKNITMHIVQPRKNNIAKWTVSKSELLNTQNKVIIPKAKEALTDKAETKFGDWCIFCKAKPICKAYSEEFNPKFKTDDPRELSNKEIAERIKVLTGAEGYLKTLKEYAVERALDGEEFPGYKVVEGRSTRIWKNQEEAFSKAQEAGYSHSNLYEQVPLSLAKLETLMGKKSFEEILGDYVEKPKGKPTLVEEKDKRPKYEIKTVWDDFEDVESEE